MRRLLSTKVTVGLLVAALLFYAVLIGAKGVALLTTGSSAGVLLGVALVILPLLGLALAWREVSFGRRSAELAAALDAEGGLPVDDLPRRPSGRVDRAAADAVFARRRAEAEERPDDWRSWYRLGVAYDDAGDRTRARSAVRRAIALYDAAH